MTDGPDGAGDFEAAAIGDATDWDDVAGTNELDTERPSIRKSLI
jgi:hypothetical protein